MQINLEDKMKIAVACEGKNITEHFGHCENFMMFETKDGKILNFESIENPGHKPGFLPRFLKSKGAEVIISGGMGGGAVEIFNELEIQVVTGAGGDAETAVISFLQGKLKSSGSICHEHSHKDECGN